MNTYNEISTKEIDIFYEGKLFGLQFEEQFSYNQLIIKNPYKPGTQEFQFWLNGYYESFK